METQQWGGKGHKQRGASGQTASIEQPKKAVGSTTLSGFQQLPSQLLNQVCQKEGRPPAKYKSIGNARYRVILQDAKVSRRGTDHDLIFVPATPGDTDDIAREEAALLALLHMTPTLPHERKLPEPFKTTWLRAVEAAKKSKQTKTYTRDDASASASANHNGRIGELRNGAKAHSSSSPLVMAGLFASAAERRKYQEKVQQERKARIRSHEAIRMANRDHPVFMSAQCRQRIETLLRGENNGNIADLLSQEEENDEGEEEENEVKTYVVQRLHTEGFTVSQARTAYSQLTHETLEDESQWDSVHEECLQWLCIHLDEDQLPEGFDPRGRTLDVVVAPTIKARGERATEKDERALALARNYGISDQEAALVLKRSSTMTVEEVLWATFCRAADVVFENDNSGDSSVANDEIEALQAIFSPDEWSIEEKNGTSIMKITFPSNDGKAFTLEIVVIDGIYPWSPPVRVLVSGGWSLSNAFGSAVHVEVVKHIATLTKGEPMIYEIYGRVTELLHSAQHGGMQHISLMPALGEKVTASSSQDVSKIKQETSRADDNATSPSLVRKRICRPQVRASFWSKAPKDTPVASAFPKTSSVISNTRNELPAAKARGEFLSVMKKADKAGRVVLVTGDTGCGKTTQIPQFILEESPADVKIVVAQPRRLAATGVATRVAKERGENQPGTGSVGYVVRGDSAMCNSTRLLFCTTGVLLRQLQNDKALDSLTHIIVDEVHERHLDTDVLLGVLKASLQSNPHLRVVLMSATLDADRFSNYWGSNTPRIHIPGMTFPVTDFMLEDVLAITGYIPRKNGKQKKMTQGYHRPRKSSAWDDSENSDEEEIAISSEKSDITSTDPSTRGDAKASSHNIPLEDLVERVDESRVDYDMLGQLVKQLVDKKDYKDDGSILVFLPGAPEINKAMDVIRKVVRGISVQLLPLHGGLQPKDQNLVFKAAERGYTKIILSTNVAETSITIPDCTIVIDSCREKQSSYDPFNRMPLLVERFAARANLKQRRGRAGRVRSGTCYKLISRKTYDNLPEHGEPEIHRCALDQTLLSLMFLGLERGTSTFLRTLLDPPSKSSVDAAVFSLQQLGAVTTGDFNLSLTPLGLHLAGIPAPPSVGKSEFRAKPSHLAATCCLNSPFYFQYSDYHGLHSWLPESWFSNGGRN
jgi:ATP-dependent RNA helicase DHX57